MQIKIYTMKYITLLVTLFLTLSFYSQTEVGFILKNSGDKISIYDGSNSNKKKSIGGMAAGTFGPIAFNEKLLYYFDFDGKIENIENTEYSEVKLGKKVYNGDMQPKNLILKKILWSEEFLILQQKKFQKKL